MLKIHQKASLTRINLNPTTLMQFSRGYSFHLYLLLCAFLKDKIYKFALPEQGLVVDLASLT